MITVAEKLYALEAVSGTLAKKATLAALEDDYPEVLTLLEYALNPFKTYGVTAPKGVYDDSEYANTIENSLDGICTLLDQLADRKLTGYAAVKSVKDMAASLEPGSADWFCRVVNKKLRMGVSVKTVNAVFPNFIPEHNVMLAERYDKRRVKFPCHAEVKLDGIRATYVKGKFFTRKGLVIPGLEDLEEFMNNFPEAEYDGELTVRGKTFQEGNGLIRAGKAGIDVVFNVFACRDNPDWKEGLAHVFNEAPELELHGLVQIVPSRLVHNHEQVDLAYADARAHGYEGLVLKTINYQYIGKRSFSWIKVKPKRDAEFRIINVYEGEGKYVNMCGGLKIKYNGQTNHVGTGFTDAQRQEFWDSPPIGQIATIEWMEDTDDGNMRNPRFKGIRWDI